MKVKELQTLSANYDAETEVCFAYSSGDYWHTTIAGNIEKAEPALIEYSAYHEKQIVVETDCDNFDEADGHEVLLLS